RRPALDAHPLPEPDRATPRRPGLAVGGYRAAAGGDLLAYLREGGGRRFLVVLNLGDAPRVFKPVDPAVRGRIALTTHLDRVGETVAGTIELRPDEGVVVEH